MKNKFACIHGHFYQPPRENPWTSAIEPEESAAPYRDWNERIFDECYGPNAACPMLGEDGLIVDMANNYRRMSFNFGPTLLSWMEKERPAVYRQILEADADSAKENDGHGNAVAQPYYHAILPLQTLRDKRTLVRWGIQDFKRRFKRDPEGMWLPETAVDEETLEVLIEEGIRFTVLSPNQAARVRDVGGNEWTDVTGLTLRPTRPYRWNSKARLGRSLSIFFYHHSLHQGIVAGDIFRTPDLLAKKIAARFHPDDSTQLVSAAADGEFFGHHHKAGAPALAHTFLALKAEGVQATTYAAFLARFPPPQEVEIRPQTAWSCEHGLGRWTRDCGCRHRKGTDQSWRGPLRDALDWLARQCDKLYEEEGGELFRDFWAARDAYDGRGIPPNHERGELSQEQRRRALCLLELQRHRLAMFTSCGWFFDEVSGLEATQCLKHAARAVDLAGRFGADLSRGLLPLLADGAAVYEKVAWPQRFSAARTAARAALLSHLGWEAGDAGQWRCRVSGLKRADKTGLAGRDRSFSMAEVSAFLPQTTDEACAPAFVYQRDRVDVACWLKDGGDFEALAADFQSQGDADFLRKLTERFGAEAWRLDALLSEERRDVMRLLMPGLADEPKRKELLARWMRALKHMRNDSRNDDVLEVLSQAKDCGLEPRHLPGAAAVRARLDRVLEGVLDEPGPQAFSRLAHWLEALQAAELPVSLWRLRHFFWTWRRKLLEKGPAPGEREAALALGERLKFSDRAMQPFGRMPA